MSKRRKLAKGITIIELVIGVVVSIIVIFTAGLLLVSGQKNWISSYEYAYGDVQVNAIETMLAFGSAGRKSNKSDYVLYDYDGKKFDGPILPTDVSNPEEVVSGNAVEFRYWDAELNDSFMDTDITGNAYRLFYVEEDQLIMETGPYPPGAILPSGGNRTPTGKHILAQNVQSVVFSHMTTNAEGDGNGCVKMDLTIFDPAEGKGIHVKTATLMRNVWP